MFLFFLYAVTICSFFLEKAKNLGRSDNAKWGKRGGWPKINKKKQTNFLRPASLTKEITTSINKYNWLDDCQKSCNTAKPLLMYTFYYSKSSTVQAGTKRTMQMRNWHNGPVSSGATIDGFLQNTLKTLSGLSRVLLHL